MRFGYRAVEEQYPPSRLLEFISTAERLGFDFIGVSDHFHPWFHEGGCAGHAWVLIAAAAARTTGIRLGTGVTTAVYRYHPAIIAQAFATLGEMFPGRIYLGLGTGEAMNELPFGPRWPPFKERAERLLEALVLIRRLWEGSFVTTRGGFFPLRDARLYTRPRERVPIYVAASGPTVARIAGRLGDGFMTAAGAVTNPDVRLGLFAALAEGVRESGRDPGSMPRMVEMKVSYDEDYERALRSLARWRVTTLPDIIGRPIADPRRLDRLGEQVDPARMAEWVCTSMEECLRKVEGLIAMGFDEVQVGSSSPDEERFLREFGGKALPYLKEQHAT